MMRLHFGSSSALALLGDKLQVGGGCRGGGGCGIGLLMARRHLFHRRVPNCGLVLVPLEVPLQIGLLAKAVIT